MKTGTLSSADLGDNWLAEHDLNKHPRTRLSKRGGAVVELAEPGQGYVETARFSGQGDA